MERYLQVGPEFAFIGHSNVGKSSLLNLITGRSDLAKVSKQPGELHPGWQHIDVLSFSMLSSRTL
eukprot:823301-Pelagomonas_calceolata.AAC.2